MSSFRPTYFISCQTALACYVVNQINLFLVRGFNPTLSSENSCDVTFLTHSCQNPNKIINIFLTSF